MVYWKPREWYNSPRSWASIRNSKDDPRECPGGRRGSVTGITGLKYRDVGLRRSRGRAGGRRKSPEHKHTQGRGYWEKTTENNKQDTKTATRLWELGARNKRLRDWGKTTVQSSKQYWAHWAFMQGKTGCAWLRAGDSNCNCGTHKVGW